MRSFCRSAPGLMSGAGGRWLRHGEYAESLRPWMRHRRRGGCGGRKGSGPPAAGRDPRARVPLVIREDNLVTEGDDLLGAGCRGFAPNEVIHG